MISAQVKEGWNKDGDLKKEIQMKIIELSINQSSNILEKEELLLGINNNYELKRKIYK